MLWRIDDRLGAHLNLITFDSNRIRIDFQSRIVRPGSIAQAEPPRVPRTRDGPVFDVTFGQRRALMWTRIVDGSELSIRQMKHRNHAFPEDKGFPSAGGQFTCGGYGFKIHRYKTIPAIQAVIQQAIAPPSMARKPSFAKSPRRSGAMPPIPPNWMPIDEKFEKPHKA